MNLHEYIEKAKDELDQMSLLFVVSHEQEPELWPLEMSEEEWADQELAQRFS